MPTNDSSTSRTDNNVVDPTKGNTNSSLVFDFNEVPNPNTTVHEHNTGTEKPISSIQAIGLGDIFNNSKNNDHKQEDKPGNITPGTTQQLTFTKDEFILETPVTIESPVVAQPTPPVIQAPIIQTPVTIESPVVAQPTPPVIQAPIIQTPVTIESPVVAQPTPPVIQAPIIQTPVTIESPVVAQPTPPVIQAPIIQTPVTIESPVVAQPTPPVIQAPIIQTPVTIESPVVAQPTPPVIQAPIIQTPVTIESPVVAQPTPPVIQAPIIQTPVTIESPVVAQPTPPVIQAPIIQTPVVAKVVPAPIVTKKGSKVSPLGFAIGCGVFGLFIVGLITGLLYFAIQNPDQFKGIIGIEGIKTGLRLFSGLFFGLIFFTFFGTAIFNLYKLITTKTGSKIGYIVGLVLSTILLIGSATGGIVAFKKINEIIGTTGANSALLVPTIEFKDGMRPINEGYPIIAPTNIYYSINPLLYKRFIATSFQNKKINNLLLACGNEQEQILSYDSSKSNFVGNCLYTKKGDYEINLIVNTTDPSTDIKKDEYISMGTINVVSEIKLTPSLGQVSLSDTKDEIIIGKAPTKLTIDSSNIFEDLGLAQYTIEWDLDNDGIFDKKNDTNFAYQFRIPQIQTVYYVLPDVSGYENLVYQFAFRVQQNDVPICTLTATSGDKLTQYKIAAEFDENDTTITSYLYKVRDLQTNKTTNITANKPSFDYEFSKRGSYIITLEYATEDGKRGYCETDLIEVGAAEFIPKYSINYKGPNDTKWQQIGQSGLVNIINGVATISTLPMRLQINITDIVPQTKQTTVDVQLDGKSIISPNNKVYELIIQDPSQEKIDIIVKDPSLDKPSIITIPLKVIQQEILGQIKSFPDTVGTSPFEVILDATTTTLNDKTDEIIYFSRDFGDGTKSPNTSQGRVSHTYIYDEKNQSGTYSPSVTITTKKGKKATLKTISPVLVKKQVLQSSIRIDSHPTQIAKIGDQVSFTVQTDGDPIKISREFGNNSPIECNDRSCTTVPTYFEKNGEYTIKSTITYADLTKSVATTKLLVE